MTRQLNSTPQGCRKILSASAIALVLAGGSATGLFICASNALAATASTVVSGPAPVRRLSADQYRNIIRDVFGASITLGGYFEPALRIDGLAAVGFGKTTITTADMEQYDAMARTIAAQVVDEKHRAQMVPCQPASATAPDDRCARQFLEKVGRLLFRHPLSKLQLDAHVAVARDAAETLGDFYHGLGLALAAMLSSPQFLFREAILEPNHHSPGAYLLNDYDKASQLSFFLWNSSPDSQLLAAAQKGELSSRKGLRRQVDRMMASPRLEAGLRAFFIDDLSLDGIDTFTKDATLFPKFSATVAADAKEQTLKTIVNVILKQRGDYRDIFTTRKTYLTPELAAIYKVPLARTGPNGSPSSWQSFEFAPTDPRQGILTQIAFTGYHSPAGRSSPTVRGKALREVILCQKVPPPPGNVKFNLINDTSNSLYKTARKRLTVHRSNPVCAGCHKIIDPIGLALENFDGAGGYRTTENGETIDTSGVLDGVSFSDAVGLAKAVHDNPATTSCLVNRLTSYALGREPVASEESWIATLKKQFAASGYHMLDLMKSIALSNELYRAIPPQSVAPIKAATGDTMIHTASAK